MTGATPGRWGARLAAALAAAVVIGVALVTFVVRFDQPERRTTGDTYFYAVQAEGFAGASTSTAEQSAKHLLCADVRNGLQLDGRITRSCLSYPVISDPRYVAIFTSRPLWPLLLAPGVRLLGLPRAVILGSLLGALLAALAVFLVLRGLGTSVLAAGAAGVTFSLLPTGYWADKLLPEGAVLAVLLAGIYGASRVVRGQLWGLAWLVPALVALYAFKPANGAALAAGLVVAGVVLLPFGKGRVPALVLVGVGGAGIAGWFVVSWLLHLPSFDETVQDLATVHFSRPDVPRPLGALRRMNVELWEREVGRWLGLPWPFAIVLPAAVITVLGLRRAGIVWAAGSLAGVSIVVAHPMITQYDRLASSVWLVVVAAVAVVVDEVPRLLRSNSGRMASVTPRHQAETVPAR